MTTFAAFLLLAQVPRTLAECRGKDFPAFETVLQVRPERSTNSIGEDRIYRTARFGVVTLHKRPKSTIVNQITIMPLKSKKTWKQILTGFGISAVGATVVKTNRGRYTIKPLIPLPTDWTIEWNPGREGDGYDSLTVWQPIRVIY